MNKPTPIVSLIMPNYNYGAYISEAIESALMQTFKEYELIIIDDASTDNSLDIILPYVEKYPHIHLIQHSENKGIAYSVNEAVKQAQGDYILLLPSDDILLPNCLKINLNFLREYSASISCSKYTYFSSKNKENLRSLDLLKTTETIYLPPDQLIEKIKKEKFWIPGNTVFIKKSLFLKHGGYENQYHSFLDWYLSLKIAFSEGIVYIPQTLTKMRKHPKSYNLNQKDKEKKEAYKNLLSNLTLPENLMLKKSFLKSDAFYHFDQDFFSFMIRSSQCLTFFKHRLWVRHFGKWFRKKRAQRKLKSLNP